MQNIALVITTPPYSALTITAIDFIQQAVKKDLTIIGVFFYQDGVLNASKHLSVPSDEYQTIDAWRSINSSFNIPLHLCISAAERRGLSDEVIINQGDSHIECSNIDEHFTVSGLGELVELTVKADKVIQL